ncbi:MAG: N-acetyltransferase [Gammaproteobacteria bacterium]|nr:N-acetyltransferase [Gammaproteobacteria bacterium]MCP4275954.1 N-acetyltransferase [Gammaproteobacteria bacterium]MCP4832170.1 N-acetyltransferase [Gammaproteobacteria bacterium]MCP4928229.1 N-acetyltransferase [Gammaproteobacteria bacterium]
MRTRVCESIQTVLPEDWNRLLSDNYPFMRHEFLSALEESGCASKDTGWLPYPILCESATGELLGAMPLYLKNNSQGEFVFDFAWARAYEQVGQHYYPKLVAAIPFTPATGPRLLVRPNTDSSDNVRGALLSAAIELAVNINTSSLHVLFPLESETTILKNHGLLLRKDCQFHWQNRNYVDFAAFLDTFTSSKRKKTRRERRRIRDGGIHFEVRNGNELDAQDWERIMPLYTATFLRHGRMPYLNQQFFELIAQKMPDNLVVFMGFKGADLVATAICFRSDTTLYGRYWGANQFIDCLHFETCYYQGIDYCIQQGLQYFEPGTQGEHKISRGFVPTQTWSAHWLVQPQFAAAIDEYLDQERVHIDEYIDTVQGHVPYRREPD